ncbi:MAG: hypothetical protein J6D47_06095 [Peptostreptococcaceae bacterium]|nr:hypothetical protein [Peptostreptococcaceae bacterium]
MKRCIFNTFRHQVTKDEDVVPMDKSELTSFGLITTYMLKAKAKTYWHDGYESYRESYETCSIL